MPELNTVQPVAAKIRENVSRVIVGKDTVIDYMVVALLCEGHILLEDVPGIGKTTMAKALARSLGCSFQRIQFTPDLLPSDVTGVSIYNQKSGEFEYRAGPIMSQIVLADEINRAGPRTQSALLEVMEERQVTVDGVTRLSPRPFLVMATQNPIELEGTFPLPEAQLDRFLMRLELGYPNFEEERLIMRRFRETQPLADLQPVVTGEELLRLGVACRRVYLHPVLENYILTLVRESRVSDSLSLGASPRASLALMRTSQALAAIHGRDYVEPDDIQALAKPVLAHRLIPNMRTRLRGRAAQNLVDELLGRIAVPVEEDWSQEAKA